MKRIMKYDERKNQRNKKKDTETKGNEKYKKGNNERGAWEITIIR